jgi:hypothetical protein
MCHPEEPKATRDLPWTGRGQTSYDDLTEDPSLTLGMTWLTRMTWRPDTDRVAQRIRAQHLVVHQPQVRSLGESVAQTHVEVEAVRRRVGLHEEPMKRCTARSRYAQSSRCGTSLTNRWDEGVAASRTGAERPLTDRLPDDIYRRIVQVSGDPRCDSRRLQSRSAGPTSQTHVARAS